MKFIIYASILIHLANQIPTLQSLQFVTYEINHEKMKRVKDVDDGDYKSKYDSWWSYPVPQRPQPDKEELTKNYEAWSSCVKSERPENECEALFEIIVAPAELIIAKLQSYKLYIAEADNENAACIESKKTEVDCNLEKSNKERVVNEWKNELYPWLEIYETCTSAKSTSFCEHYIKLLHLPENHVMKPEDQIKMMQLLICAHSGGSTEKCIEDSKIPSIELVKMPKDHQNGQVQGAHVRDGDDL